MFLVAVDPEDEARRLFASVKLNIAAKPPTMAYRITGTDNGCSRIEWAGTSTYTAESLTRIEGEAGEERSARDEATEWLRDCLARNGGEAAAKDVIKAARGDGIAEKTLRRAHTAAGVKARKSSFDGPWLWAFDIHADTQDAQDAPQDAQDGHIPDKAPWGMLAILGPTDRFSAVPLARRQHRRGESMKTCLLRGTGMAKPKPAPRTATVEQAGDRWIVTCDCGLRLALPTEDAAASWAANHRCTRPFRTRHAFP